MENKTCLECDRISSCKKLEDLKDDEGRVSVQILNAFADTCDEFSKH